MKTETLKYIVKKKVIRAILACQVDPLWACLMY